LLYFSHLINTLPIHPPVDFKEFNQYRNWGPKISLQTFLLIPLFQNNQSTIEKPRPRLQESITLLFINKL